MKQDYQRQQDAIVARLAGTRPRLLLHSCCGPCSSACLERLTPHFETTVFFYDPNILPEAEHDRRLEAQRQLLALAPFAQGVTLLTPPREEEAFRAAARGLEGEPEGGARCTRCFLLRLERSAQAAAQGGFPWFTTTLTVSPHKDAARLNEIGQALALRYGVSWLPCDFKKRDGYRRSVELSRQYGLYRQSWCGCGWPEAEA